MMEQSIFFDGLVQMNGIDIVGESSISRNRFS